MCSLFGIIDYSNALPTAARKIILRELSKECEVRGTDATGISFNTLGSLKIYKKPVKASKFNFRLPFDSKVIMGHTRMTTKGNQNVNINNHPFPGHVPGMNFSLAHNGVLRNDEALRKSMKLPDTNIETDSLKTAASLTLTASRLWQKLFRALSALLFSLTGMSYIL